jgi:hypothetical protein
MAIQTSPGVVVVEKDLSQVVTFSPTNEGAIVGNFSSGPMEKPVLISSAGQLVRVFGKPTDSNASAWYSAWNYLQYSNKLWVIRVAPEGVLNAGTTAGIKITNADQYELTGSVALAAAGRWICKQPGLLGNNLRVVMIDQSNYDEFADLTAGHWGGDNLSQFVESKPLSSYLKEGKPSTTDYVATRAIGSTDKGDELVIFVIDKTGVISGKPGTVLEVHEGLSKASDAVNYKGQSIYYKNYVNNGSNYIYWASHPAALDLITGAGYVSFGGTAYDVQDSSKQFELFEALTVDDTSLSFGNAGSAPQDSEIIDAYNTVANKEEYNVSFFITAAYSANVTKHVVQNICEVRKDAIAFITPNSSGSPYLNRTTLVTDLAAYKETTLNINSSYAVMDSGFKYQYDNYNKKYRWIPLCGDIAGLCARTDSESEPWFSPAGYNRGQVKNVTKLSSNLDQASRDILYPKGINAVVAFPGQGTVLYGDKTLQTKASAFDRINVRRLFIILEKAIADAAKYQLFELNDEFTRTQFKALVEPFLRTVQGRRGLQDFKVVCDTSNNTEEVISRNEFVADIYILPLYSINYITLNFIATKSQVQFNQVA